MADIYSYKKKLYLRKFSDNEEFNNIYVILEMSV